MAQLKVAVAVLISAVSFLLTIVAVAATVPTLLAPISLQWLCSSRRQQYGT